MFLSSTLICALIVACVSRHIVKKPTLQCEYYNASSCENDSSDCPKVEYCKHEIRSHCFALWKMNASGEYIHLKGCFANNVECYDQHECVEKRMKPTKDMMFCCCEGDMCNRNFTWDPTPTPPRHKPFKPTTEQILEVYLIIPVVVVTIIIVILNWYLKRRYMSYLNEIPTTERDTVNGTPSPELEHLDEISITEPGIVAPPTPELEMGPMHLIAIEGRGRFGVVWKAQNRSETVAVRIFSMEDKEYWLTEKEIYELPQMNHPDLCEFLGAGKCGNHPQPGYWLVTAFHERGSLRDYLKANVVTWSELCRITECISRGLAFLHHEALPSPEERNKPGIAHGDFKSKNVLLKSDMSAVIADFSLALPLPLGEPLEFEESAQAGAKHYMAPEVLAADILYSREAYFRIDMYACGLVLWELASRCKAQDGPIPEYKLPFEEEVGRNPTLKAMFQCVAKKRRRPVIRDTWRQNPEFSGLCDTIEECWDHDAEARLTAACVMERVFHQFRYDY